MITALASVTAFFCSTSIILISVNRDTLPRITSRLSEYSQEYPHLIFGIPGRIEIVGWDFLIPTSKLASIVIRNNNNGL